MGKTKIRNHKLMKHNFKPNFSHKFEIEEEDQENLEDKFILKKEGWKDESGKFKTEINDSDSHHSSSYSISSHILNGLKKENTIFHSLSKKNHSKLNRKSSQLSNGLFRIPEQPEYE